MSVLKAESYRKVTGKLNHLKATIKKHEWEENKMICKGCKHFFTSGKRPDGLPNGCGFQLENGKIIDLCTDCLIRLGQMDDEQKREFIDRLQGKTEGKNEQYY